MEEAGRRAGADREEAAGSPVVADGRQGQVVFFVRIGWKPLEFEKGKAGVVAGTMEKLPEVIDVLIGAARAGELDPMLEQAKTARPAPKKKAA